MNTIAIVIFEKFRLWIISLIFLISYNLQAQDAINQSFKTQTINRLNELMIEQYVFPEVAQKTADHLKAQLKEGIFDEYKDINSFAKALTEAVQSINKDKHMRVRPAPVYEAPSNDPMRMVEEQLDQQAKIRQFNYGFKSVKQLEDNIGYIDLTGFANANDAIPFADAAMTLLQHSDAIIFDIRRNGGGDPDMVQYLCSYFFKERIHLNSLYWRQGDQTQEFWTLDKVNGQKMPDVPIFIVTSGRTFSAAEEFSYNMQTRKRATLVGETTGGGANPGGMMPINEQLVVFIPTGRAINPITKTNWEGVGVIPEIKVNKEEALDKAIELAQEAAQQFRADRLVKHKKLYTNLIQSIQSYTKGQNTDKIIKNMKACLAANLLDEGSINGFGYEMMEMQNNFTAALAIFESNTILHPQSANTYDSYAEALLAVGNKTKAIKNYEKAVKLGAINNDPNLDLYKRNLQNAKQ